MESMQSEESEILKTKLESAITEDAAKEKKPKDIMTTSASSSLVSPVDSGVQLLDSESDQTSVMTASGFDLDSDPVPATTDKFDAILNEIIQERMMTKSDIVNQNVPPNLSTESTPKTTTGEDLMNVSLNSYELLDYTTENRNLLQADKLVDQMHVSMSEEVNEMLLKDEKIPPEKIPPIEPNVAEDKPEEQIVFRRARKKKKSDTPKKRVSFHEDILNSTKIDDVHINHGFITMDPDVSSNYLLQGFIKKADVVKGRYSWAAEGDAPFYEKEKSDREVQSDIYVATRWQPSISSSSSSGSAGSSIDEEDEDEAQKMPLTDPLKMPKSSCLKKKLNTSVVEEELSRKKSETNLLDANIFGSLKNILSFSSVPLVERGVPEGQEDIICSTSHDAIRVCEELKTKEPIKRVGNLTLDSSRSHLKLKILPQYSKPVSGSNILVCDSNVYEHKGITYSYEYDSFQKSFEQQQSSQSEKPKSSTIYQKILKEFNFFKRRAKEEQPEEDFETFPASTPCKEGQTSEEVKEIYEENSNSVTSDSQSINRYATNSKMDWTDGSDIFSTDFSEGSSRHLQSPKRRINKSNHYAIQGIAKSDDSFSKSLPNLRNSSSKNSLINRFLRNVTLKKILDTRLQRKLKRSRRYMSLYIRGARANKEMSKQLDRQIEEEILSFRAERCLKNGCDSKTTFNRSSFRMEMEKEEVILGSHQVSSAYTTDGHYKPLILVLTNTTMYLAGFKKQNKDGYCNHFVLPYVGLNTILVGPNSQTIHFSNYENDMQCLVTTGCQSITDAIIVQLELAMRRDRNKPPLPAIKQLNMRDMRNLRRAICKQSPVSTDDEYFYYSIVNMQDHNADDSPDYNMGPNKEGPLMFKLSDAESRWETAYFILKSGVLYMLSSPSHQEPMKIMPLMNGACQGAKRIFVNSRPHTFMLIVSGNALYLAAPDEYVASDWLQALVRAASGIYSKRQETVAQASSLLMTSEHLLLVREAFPCNIIDSKCGHDPIKGAKVLSCANIQDITSFRLPSAEQSWCIMEFACREVHESSGDWILYFATNKELEHFMSTLEMLWSYHQQGESFPLSTINQEDLLSEKCTSTYNSLHNGWYVFYKNN